MVKDRAQTWVCGEIFQARIEAIAWLVLLSRQGLEQCQSWRHMKSYAGLGIAGCSGLGGRDVILDYRRNRVAHGTKTEHELENALAQLQNRETLVNGETVGVLDNGKWQSYPIPVVDIYFNIKKKVVKGQCVLLDILTF